MKTNRFSLLFAGIFMLGAARIASAQGTAINYQGILTSGAASASGAYDFTFQLFTASTGGVQIGPSLTNLAVGVTNGQFLVTLDFGAGVFKGTNYWLTLGVRTNGTGAFNVLSPRQEILPAPYAITAANLSGVVENNSIGNSFATIGGGTANVANGSYATIGGGFLNVASGMDSTVGGGTSNTASGQYSTVAGGHANIAQGDFSFAGGNGAQALHQGSFVWADDNGGSFASTAANQFAVRALNGVLFAANVQMGTSSSDYRRFQLGGGNSSDFLYGSYPAFSDGVHLGYNYYADGGGTGHVINSGGATSRITTGYGQVVLAIGGVNSAPTTSRLLANSTGVTVYGTFNNSSDRNAKQDFVPVNAADILARVLELPVTEWSYKTDVATRHIGPVAQDFYSFFNVGTDDKHIAPIDEGGVAFTAIKGLNQKLEEQTRKLNEELKTKDKEIEELNQRLKKIETLLAPESKTH